MDLKRKAWLIILTAVIVMTVACFSPSVNLGNEIVPGYVAAALSVVGTIIGIAEDRPEFAVACGLGGMANIMFIVAFISLILRHLFRWKRAHRRLSVYAMIGFVAAISSVIWLYPTTNYLGAWLWVVAYAALGAGLWILPQPEGKRGFQVLAVPKQVLAIPLVGVKHTQNPI